MGGSEKCMHKSLSIEEKEELLQEMDKGNSVKCLCEMYNNGSSTVYDLERQKDKLPKFYAESDKERYGRA